MGNKSAKSPKKKPAKARPAAKKAAKPGKNASPINDLRLAAKASAAKRLKK
jgi:hypothetical protein